MDKNGEIPFCDVKSIVPPANLKELIEQLREIFSYDEVNIDYVRELMASYKSNPKEWKQFALFDTHRYTRNLVDEGNGKFNLMILCWNEGQGSSIHSHANSHCFLKVLSGDVREEMYDWPEEGQSEEGMNPVNINSYKENQCAYICDEMGLHRVENPSHADKGVTLHLYSPPFDACKSFDQRTGHERTVKVTFWSEFGERTPFLDLNIIVNFMGAGEGIGPALYHSHTVTKETDVEKLKWELPRLLPGSRK